jgi:hypothetical protein
MAQTDDDLERDALLRQLEATTLKDGNTGVAGNAAEVAASRGLDAPALQTDTPAEPPAAPAVDYRTLGQYGDRLEGFDQGKLTGGHDSAKYQIGTALSHFDPRQGITADALGALNGLGIGTFSGQGDKLRVTGGSHGLQGDTDLDTVRGFKDPNGTGGWQYGVEADDVTRAGGGGAAPGGGAQAAGPSSFETIQGLMPTDTDFYRKLQDQLAQAAGGYSALDRDALLRMMGGASANAR